MQNTDTLQAVRERWIKEIGVAVHDVARQACTAVDAPGNDGAAWAAVADPLLSAYVAVCGSIRPDAATQRELVKSFADALREQAALVGSISKEAGHA